MITIQELADKYPVALVNSVNPDRIEGQKTASFEIVDRLGDAPDLHVLPVGNAGNITAYWKGYVEYKNDLLIQIIIYKLKIDIKMQRPQSGC
jgi:threonine synthase